MEEKSSIIIYYKFMNRVSVYLKTIKIQDGIVFYSSGGRAAKSLKTNSNKSNYLYTISTSTLKPKDVLNLTAAGNVTLSIITPDQDTNSFYDLGETLTTDRLCTIRIRQFIVTELADFRKNSQLEGIVLADLEY